MTRISRECYGGPIKLYECVAQGSGSGAELFVVDGGSAAASVSRAKVARHTLFAALTAAIGTGMDPHFDPA